LHAKELISIKIIARMTWLFNTKRTADDSFSWRGRVTGKWPTKPIGDHIVAAPATLS
jgi:hypothetical protein